MPWQHSLHPVVVLMWQIEITKETVSEGLFKKKKKKILIYTLASNAVTEIFNKRSVNHFDS